MEKAESWLSTTISMSGTSATVGVGDGSSGIIVDVGAGASVLVGEADTAVGLAGIRVGATGASVDSSVPSDMAV